MNNSFYLLFCTSAGFMVGSDLRADVPEQYAAGDHRPHQMVQARGRDARREGQLRRLISLKKPRLLDRWVFVRWLRLD
jgi:hypothetical protein